jgi:HD-like signal output (HDOD) protein
VYGVLPIPEKIIESIEAIHFPTMPQMLVRFMKMADDKNVSIADLATLAGRDPALTAQVLTIANSALLKGRGESNDLALSLAGIGTRLTLSPFSCCSRIKQYCQEPVLIPKDRTE